MGFLSSLGSAIVGAVAGHWSAKQNAKIQRDQWRYQQSNAHQLEVQDLRNAGLNPILSASNSQLASMPQVTDNGLGSSVTSALSESMSRDADRGLKAEVSAKELENEKTRLEIEKMKADWFGKKTESDIKLNAADIILKKANSDYLIGETTNSAKRTMQDITESNARIEEIKQNVKNSVAIVNKQLEVMDSQKAMNYAQANLFVENLKKIASDIGVNDAMIAKLEQEKESIISDLTNPQKVMERDVWERAARGENALGIVHKIMMPVKEFTSSIGLTLAPRLGPTYVSSVKAVQK